MPQFFSSALFVCWGALALVFAPRVDASTRVELYQVTVPLPDRGEASQTRAFQEAMKSVLIRATGARSVDEDAGLAPLIGNARRYVQQYRAATDGQLWVAFDGAAIERWLTQNGQPVWGRDRPTTFVWLSVPGAGQGAGIVTADDTSELKGAVDAAAQARGLPLVWPAAADLQKSHVDASALTAGSSTLVDLSRRLGGDAVLIGRASGSSAASTVRWTHFFQDRSSEYAGTVEGVNRAADLYAGLFAASGSLVPLDIEVTGIGGLRDYAGVQSYLESLTSISRVNVLALEGDTVKLRLATRGGVDALHRALSLGGRLAPSGAGDNGIQRFQLHR